MALGLAGGYGAAGAADGLREVLARRMREILMRNQQRDAEQGRALQSRGLDLTQQGQELAQGRFDTSRNDAMAAAAAEAQQAAQKAKELKAAQDAYLQQNPHLAPMIQGHNLFKLPVSDQHKLETPEVHGAHEAEAAQRSFGDFTEREKFKNNLRMRELGAQQAGARSLEQLRQAGREKPPAGGGSPYAAERGTRISESVDDLIGRVGPMTVGLGAKLSWIPGTSAKDFKADLDKLKANIAFGELTEMREASKTGGALGQVSNIELGLLQSAQGALDQEQSPENFIKNLKIIKDVSARWQKAKADAAGGGGTLDNSALSEFDWTPGKGLVRRGGNP